MAGNNQVSQLQKRGSGGRFAVEGAPKKRGRPTKVVQEAYLKRLHESVPLEEWDEIIAKAVAQAKNGDYRARQWLADYCMGKPTTQEEPAYVDQRSVVFDLSNLSGDELAAAIQLAQLVDASSGAGETEPE